MPNPSDAMWATVRGNSATSTPNGVLLLPPNQIIVAGDFNLYQSFFVSLAAFSKYNVTSPPVDVLDYVNSYGSPTCSYSFYGSAIDSSGNLLLTGTFCGTINFSNSYDPTYDIPSPGADGIFVVKLDSSGNLIWQIGFGGNSGTSTIQFGYDVAIDSDDNVLVTGTYNQAWSIDTTLYGNTIMASSGGSSNDIFIMKFARDAAVGPGKKGQCIWARGFTSTPQNLGYVQGGHGICVDSSKNVYCTGSFYGTINFGGSNLVCFGSSNTDPFVVKLDTNGNHIWSTSFPNSGYHCFASVTLGRDNMARGSKLKWSSPNTLYVGGCFNGACRFGTFNLNSQSCVDAFFLKMDANNPSSISWISTIGGVDPSGSTSINLNRVMSINVAPNGDIVVGGYFIGTGDIGFNGTTIGSVGPSLGVWDTYVFRYGPDGTIAWKKTIGDSSSPTTIPASSIAFDQNSNVWIAIRFRGTIALGGTAGSISSPDPRYAVWGVIQLYGGGGISPPNPCNFSAVYAPSASPTSQAKFGFSFVSDVPHGCLPMVMPSGVSNILIQYMFPSGTVTPTPNVATTPFLLLNYLSPNTYGGLPAYGFVYKVVGGNGTNSSGGIHDIGTWQWRAAWADASGVQVGDYTDWQTVTRSAAINLSNDATIANTPYSNRKANTIQTVRGPMQIVS